MIPNKRLIKALRDSVEYLSDPENKYEWGDYTQCTCGTVTKFLLEGVEEVEVSHIHYVSGDGGWTSKANKSYLFECPQTGLPYAQIFRELHKAGLNKAEDFLTLEYCGRIEDKKKFESLSLEDRITALEIENNAPSYMRREVVIEFLNELADKLETQLISQEAASNNKESVRVCI
ncbi:hypothetical protein H6G33_10240 [Calothrix sp. FACHB-1219]|uniref:hypothetical protein n=1 Tax=unclassified Calothrix TaxID=2619626 RepID=UPI001685AFBA|nr:MULTISPECIES: hypothetical protein [unclassified Calothrix]MBD2201726.1 hypothetical protein [Calothrix sp. FACHB-168]MBD2217412.1 hypothetical protein [Calothrix sp. FACHB-1219]